MNSAFVAVIPARLASTRLPRKPLVEIAGKPMVVHVADRARAAGAARVIIATDAAEVVEAVAPYGIETMLTSPAHPTGTDRLAEVVDRLALADEFIVVNVQGDEPLVPPELVRACAQLLAERAECAIATVAHPIHAVEEFMNPNVVKVALDAHDRALYFSRAPIPFPRDAVLAAQRAGGATPDLRDAAALQLPSDFAPLRHIGLYAYRAGFLRVFPSLARPAIEQFECLEQLRALAHGYPIAVLRTPHAPPAGVDTAEDLARVRLVLGRTK